MSLLGAAAIVVLAFGVVCLMVWSLVSRLREERRQQDPAVRSPWWRLLLVGGAVAGVMLLVGARAGFEPVAVFRFALLAVLGLSAVRYFRGR